ncbi:MAG: hypothetical protein FJ145_02435 [Deltaproteobacteria bacterium]|nr:hypothetical protein [Deltaproteobacteria bacterium]
MLKITEQYENEKTLRLRLDGTVDSTSLTELQNVLSQGNDTNGLTVILDTAGVTFMNEQAANQLAKLRNQSLHIVNGSPFIEMLLNSALY